MWIFLMQTQGCIASMQVHMWMHFQHRIQPHGICNKIIYNLSIIFILINILIILFRSRLCFRKLFYFITSQGTFYDILLQKSTQDAIHIGFSNQWINLCNLFIFSLWTDRQIAIALQFKYNNYTNDTKCTQLYL